MKRIHLLLISAGLVLTYAAGSQASEYDIMTNMRVEGDYAVFKGTAEVQGNAFSVGGSTLAVQNGKVGVGTSNPSFLLHVSSASGVAGNLLVISTGTSDVIRMTGAGDIYANKFYGDVSGASGLPTVSGDDLGSHIATATVNMASWNLVNVSSVNFLSNVFLTSATAANYGGVYASTHVYTTGNIYAANFYGDVSGASGLPGGDSLGTHVATQTLNMAGFNIINASSINYMSNVFITSGTEAQYGGIYVSTHVYLPTGAKFYGDGSGLTGLVGTGDDLGNHIATTTLNMATFNIVNVASITATAAITTYSTMTVAGNAFSVGGSTLTVSEGKVGIGVAAPGMPLEVKNTGATFKVNTGVGYVSLYIEGAEMVRMKQ